MGDTEIDMGGGGYSVVKDTIMWGHLDVELMDDKINTATCPRFSHTVFGKLVDCMVKMMLCKFAYPQIMRHRYNFN